MTKEDILKGQWTNLGRWVQPVISGCFWTHWNEASAVRKIMPNASFSQIIFLDGHTLCAQEDETYVERYLLEAYKNGSLMDFCSHLERVAIETTNTHLALLTSKSPIEEYTLELLQTYQEVVGVWTYLFLVHAIERIARSIYPQITDDELLRNIKPFIKATWLEEQIKDVARLVVKARALGIEQITETSVRADKDLSVAIDAHLEEYAWFGTHHWEGEGYTRAKLIADMQEALQNPKTIEEPRESQVPQGGNEALWRMMGLAFYWRTHCAEVTAKVVFASRSRLIELAGKWNMSYEDFIHLSADEIKVAIEQKSLRLPSNYTERKKAYGCYIVDDVEHVVAGSELEEIMSRLVQTQSKETITEFKGTVASKKPSVQGIARIILAPRDFSRFKDGEILIAPETTPDFVPLMKIARAIVTEVGGITSHAAIVSRELGVPCVIGTKIATQVLRDGDVVEVDATSGTIRIITRAT